MAESFSREKLRHASQKEGGWIRITVVVSHIEKNKNRQGSLLFITQRGVCKSQINVEDLYTWP